MNKVADRGCRWRGRAEPARIARRAPPRGVRVRRARSDSACDTSRLRCFWSNHALPFLREGWPRWPTGVLGGHVNKAQFIEALATRLGSDKKAAGNALDAVLDEIYSVVVKGEKLALTGFGSFEKRDRGARVARNPATGASVRVKKTSVPAFRAGAEFKAVVSGAKKLPKPAKKAAAAVKATPARRSAAAPGGSSASNGASGGNATPGKASATKATTSKATGAKAAATKTAPAKSAATKAAPAKRPAAKASASGAAKSAPASKATAGKATAGKATTGKATASKATAGKATAGKATAGKATAGKATAAKATAAPNGAGEPAKKTARRAPAKRSG
ncbi:MAG TPA: HU family DNA-binding protein [Jatrophihabitans sp.]